MNFQKAISILGLSANFTEEELKKAHRRLTIENHPDKHQDNLEMNERQTQINAARDFLKPYAKKERQPQTNNFDIKEYIQQKIKNLDDILEGYNATIAEESYQQAYKSINQYINLFKLDVFISYLLTRKDVDESYDTTIFSIKSTLETFKESFYKEHHIDENEIKETLVYNCGLEHFYEQLLEIEKKYSKEAKLQKLLEKEIEKYKTYAGYKELYQLIMIYKNNTIIRIRKKCFENIEEEISNMHHLIEKEVFEAYYSLQERISNLGNELSLIANEPLQKEYESLKHEFLIGTNFGDIENHIAKIEQLLKEHNDNIRKQQEFKQIEDQVNDIYKSLIDKYNDSLKKHNPITSHESIKKLTELFGEILEIFKLGCDQFKELDYFNLFLLLTFTDINEDSKIIQTIVANLEPEIENKKTK